MGDHQANPKREPRVQDPIDDQGFIAALQDASLQDASLQLHLVPSPARSQRLRQREISRKLYNMIKAGA
jgi:hypothetical protein